MKLIYFFIISILSLFLYLFAPDKYDFNFCVTVFILFIVSGVLQIIEDLKEHNNFFNFYVLFFISFLYVNFVYPIFIFPTDPDYFPVFKFFKFDSNLMSKTTALAQLGFSFYCLGVSFFSVIKKPKINKSKMELNLSLKDVIIYKYIINILTFLFLFLCISIFFIARDGIFSRDPFAFEETPPALIVFSQVVLTICILLSFLRINYFEENKSFWSVLRFNKILLISILLFLFMFIYPGDRGPAIQVVLTFIFCYSIFVKPIKFKLFLFIVLIGMFVLTFISYARINMDVGIGNGGNEGAKIGSLTDIGMDLIVNNRNLYVGYEIAEKQGLNYGKSMFYYIFSPFPMLPSYVSGELFDAEPMELATSTIITEYSKANYGLGTNLIIDLYMQFGVLGVLIFMFILGYFIANVSNRKSIIAILSFTFFMSYSIYIPRSSMFDSIRFIVWSITVYYIFYYFFNPGVKNKLHGTTI